MSEIQKWIWRQVVNYYAIIMRMITVPPLLYELIAHRISANIRVSIRESPEWYVDLKKRSRFMISPDKFEFSRCMFGVLTCYPTCSGQTRHIGDISADITAASGPHPSRLASLRNRCTRRKYQNYHIIVRVISSCKQISMKMRMILKIISDHVYCIYTFISIVSL